MRLRKSSGAIRLSLQRATGDFGDSEIMASRQDNEQFFGMEPMDASQQYLYRRPPASHHRLRATVGVTALESSVLTS
ncbi:MAG: hypothetical protein R3C18_17535 [Planctomycetaceae bacterium]